MSYREARLACPSCRLPLAWFVHDERHLGRCAACHGTWMEVAELLTLIRDALPDKALDELMVHNDGSPRRPCPVCGETMDIAWIDFLQLDQCEAHGVWLDGGELQKVCRWEVGAVVVGRPPSRVAYVHGKLVVVEPR